MRKTIVMSLGGSLIAPDGIDAYFLKNFKKIILDYVNKGNRVILICGGGNIARIYQGTAKKIFSGITSRDLDWIGIAATKINAELISGIFGSSAMEGILQNPEKEIKTSKKIIVGAGWMPGSSSDKDAVLAAKTYGADTVVNLSNISYVYDRDPKKYKDAKAQKKITWSDFQKIVGSKWIPGANLPFDPVATKLAKKFRMELIVIKGSDLQNLRNFLNGKEFVGSIIK